MIGKALVLLLTALLTSCVDPKYVQPLNVAGSAPGGLSKVSATLPVSGLQVWLSWEVWPKPDDFGRFLLKFGRPNAGDGSPVVLPVDGEIQVVLRMPSMGHGSSPVTVESVDTGTYRASNVFFNMPGDWEIRIHRYHEGRLIESAFVPLRF